MVDGNSRGEIDISRIPATGVGGLGLVAMAALVAWFVPALRWLAVAALVGGIGLGLTLIGVRNRRARRNVVVAAVLFGLALATGLYMVVALS